MKKTKIFLVVLIIIIFMASSGCKEKEEEKNYQIVVYYIDWDKVKLITGIFKYANKEKEVQLLEEAIIDKNTTVEHFYAKEIISYTEKSIRFIDKNNVEMFISADYIKVREY